MNYCNWCRYKNTNGFKNNAPQCNLHAKLTNRFRISTRIPDREEKKSCSYTQLIRTDWSPSLANMFERIQTHSNAFKWVDHLRLHDEIPLSPHSQTHSNGLIVFICKHVWTHSNVFKRIQTDWSSSFAWWNPTEPQLERAPDWSCLLARKVSATGLQAHAFNQLMRRRTKTGQNTSLQPAKNINIKNQQKKILKKAVISTRWIICEIIVNPEHDIHGHAFNGAYRKTLATLLQSEGG